MSVISESAGELTTKTGMSGEPVRQQQVKESRYFIVGFGESYETSITTESDLVNAFIRLMFYDPPSAPDDEVKYWKDRLENPDNWKLTDSGQRMIFGEDIGETDRVEIFLI
jgi:hypothetical protein